VHGMGLAQDGSKAKVPNLDLAGVAIDEDVVALEVTVDDGRVIAVEVDEGTEDLATPVLDGMQPHTLVLLPVPKQTAQLMHGYLIE
jgi:DUF1009 family protein